MSTTERYCETDCIICLVAQHLQHLRVHIHAADRLRLRLKVLRQLVRGLLIGQIADSRTDRTDQLIEIPVERSCRYSEHWRFGQLRRR